LNLRQSLFVGCAQDFLERGETLNRFGDSVLTKRAHPSFADGDLFDFGGAFVLNDRVSYRFFKDQQFVDGQTAFVTRTAATVTTDATEEFGRLNL
jgi:hypothetical protein